MRISDWSSDVCSSDLSGTKGGKQPVHPNDHVNMGQSSNDSFPTVMHIAAVQKIVGEMIPALGHLHAALDAKAQAFEKIIQIGRTHLMDETRSEEHTSEIQSLMRNSHAGFSLTKKHTT